jgi:sigma-B regulation protein RsbU (phosphoserine phosphatase)
VVVGDVVGHGISAALLMASVRSALRQRLASAGSISEVIADVNRQMTADLADSGRFVTLLYLVVDPQRRIAKWVRAGHDPAILYDPTSGEFSELAGYGMALGVDRQCRYEENLKENLPRGSIILMGTDGIWETRNQDGMMFGRAALYDTIRNYSTAGAAEIMSEIIDRIDRFRNVPDYEDDVTLVVIKLV